MKVVLSRFAAVHREGDRLVAQGAEGPAVPLDGPGAAALLAALARPRPLDEAAAAAGLSVSQAQAAAAPLLAAGIIVDADRGAREDASPWPAPERIVHGRSRSWHPSPPSRPAPPVFPPQRWEPAVALPAPDHDALERDDPPLARVQSLRRSIREYAEEPMTVGQLGELLHRVARVEELWQAAPDLEIAPRPHPAAGALYELELYPVVAACDGVEPGLYHYAAQHHRLDHVAPAGSETDQLLRTAASGMGAPATPPVLIVIAGRFERLAWKYGELAYTLMLKDSGVLLQTLYLATTAMGLAGCAVGAGDGGLFARATGLDPDDQTSVAEFCVGQRRSRSTASPAISSPR